MIKAREAIARALDPSAFNEFDWPSDAREDMAKAQIIAQHRADAALAALDAAGWAVVPKEPTEAMCRAYYEASAQAAREDFDADPGPYERLEPDQIERLKSFGRAMIAAHEDSK